MDSVSSVDYVVPDALYEEGGEILVDLATFLESLQGDDDE